MSNPLLLSTLLLSILFPSNCLPQDTDLTSRDHYSSAMEHYEGKNYLASARHFLAFIDTADSPAKNHLYNGACIFALAGETDRAISTLEKLVDEHFYSDLDHLSNDTDLFSLHKDDRWKLVVEKAKSNLASQPRRNRILIKEQLSKAKRILRNDGGQLWGVPIWSTDILVLDYDNTIYSLAKLPDGQTDDGIIFYKKIPENTLSFTNSAQTYEGKRVAVVMLGYIDDNCSTIIHELFHVLQLKVREFRSDPVNYLDEHEARVLLRLEFQALRNALKSADNDKRQSVSTFLGDAVSFRKIRQTKYQEYRTDELEIETLEGMANYTGMKLSTFDNKFQKAIDEINGRESASTYTRPFPYATGPAYGLLFDYLELSWRSDDLNTIYDFASIFEAHAKQKIAIHADAVEQAQQRNNYAKILAEETERKKRHEKNIVYYSRMLINQPTLKVKPTDGAGSYSMSFDMNGTLVLGDEGIVYSHIKGTDLSGNNFGNFNSIAGKDQLGVAGILRTDKGEYVFPLPTTIEERTIIGEYYEIQLNEGWKVQKVNAQGDLEIVNESDD